MGKKLFEYNNVVQHYADEPEKMACIRRYEEMYGINRGSNIEEHPFYKDYLTLFTPHFELIAPKTFAVSPQEWNVMTRLVVSSLSSSYSFILDDEWKRCPMGKPHAHLCISVGTAERHITRLMDELFASQIKRLFEIYVNEQIEMHMLEHEEEQAMSETTFCSIDEESSSVTLQKKARYWDYDRKSNSLIREAEFYTTLWRIIQAR